MKVTSISFMQTFPTGNFSNQKLGIEIEVGDDEQTQTDEVFSYAKELVGNAFKALNPALSPSLPEQQTQIHQPPPVIDRGKETLKEVIDDCTTEEEMYRIKDADIVRYGLTGYYIEKLEKIKPIP